VADAEYAREITFTAFNRDTTKATNATNATEATEADATRLPEAAEPRHPKRNPPRLHFFVFIVFFVANFFCTKTRFATKNTKTQKNGEKNGVALRSDRGLRVQLFFNEEKIGHEKHKKHKKRRGENWVALRSDCGHRLMAQGSGFAINRAFSAHDRSAASG
jgi:hypothetical protein